MEGKVEGAHRMVTTINSPSLPREQPLCAARMDVETGGTVAEQLFVQMEGLELTDSVAYMVADTPSVNFGQDEGAIMNFQRMIQRPILAIPCPHHTEELPAKAVAEVISGRPSTGPKDPLLQLWNTSYNDVRDAITEEVEYRTFDWDEEVDPPIVPFFQQLVLLFFLLLFHSVLPPAFSLLFLLSYSFFDAGGYPAG
jgi:hypothetical protein